MATIMRGQWCIICQEELHGGPDAHHSPPVGLGRRSTVVHRAKGDYLFHSGESSHGVWAVCEGEIKVFRQTESGKQLTNRVVLPGDIVGHRSVFAGEPYVASGIAMVDTELRYMPAAVFMRMIAESREVREYVFHALGVELGHAEHMAILMAYESAIVRVATTLLELCEDRARDGESDGASGRDDTWELTILRKELAQRSGLTIEAAVRALKALEHDGIVESIGHSIRILDPDRLRDTV